jgi:hypothetical protein
MENLINQFKKYLNKQMELAAKAKDSNYYQRLIFINNFLEINNEDDNGHYYYINFDILSDVVEQSPFPLQEQLKIIFFVLYKNIKNVKDIKDVPNVRKINAEAFLKYPFKLSTIDEVLELFESGKLFTLEENKNLASKLKFLEISKAIEENSVELPNISCTLYNIKKYFFDKYPNIIKEDVNIIIHNLRELKISETLILEIDEYLKNFQTEKDNKEDINAPKLKSIIINYCTNLEKDTFSYPMNISTLKQGINQINELVKASILYSYLNYPASARLNKIVINDFQVFSKALLTSNLNFQDKFNALMYIIENNLKNGILIDNITVASLKNSFAYEMLKDDENSKEDLSSIYYENAFPYAFSFMYRKKCLNEIIAENKIKFLYGTFNPKEFSAFQNAHRLIKIYYLEKVDTFTEEDITYLTQAFQILNLPKELIKNLEKYLWRSLSKRNKTLKEENKVIPQGKPIIKELNPLINKKEYNLIYKELLTYYNFDQMLPFKYLTPNDIIHCLKLLKKLNYCEKTIQEFIISSEKFNKSFKINPIVKYLELKDKIDYYSENEELQSMLVELKKAFDEANQNEDNFYQEYLDMILDNILELLPNTHEYELNAATLTLKD